MREFIRLITIMVIATLSGLFIKQVKGEGRSIAINALSLVTGSYNIEPSFRVSKNYTIHASLSWNPHLFKENTKIKHLAVMGGIRWWSWHSYSGFFIASYATAIKYNIGVKSFRYEGGSGGLSTGIGYAWMVSPSLNIEIEGALLCGLNRYNRYEKKRCGEYLESFNAITLLPAKLPSQ